MASTNTSAASERTPLLEPSTNIRSTSTDQEARPPEDVMPGKISSSITRIITVLLIGGFISNADGSLLLATHPIIASEFHALDNSSWLINSFALASAATQPLYGKLSDIYGRKRLLILAYALFTTGLVIVGLGTSMSQLILGRIVSGAGASGMTVLVSILITDLLPLRDVASWRSYVNIVSTTGRSIGGPLGGWLADTVGWRWSFLGQAPFALLGILLVSLTLPTETPNSKVDDETSRRKLARVDFIGAILMTLTILSFLFPLEIAGVKVAWSHPAIWGLLSSGLVFGTLFLLSQAYIAKEPIFPLELLRQKDFVASILAMTCQSAAQLGMMFAVPLYFQITSKASNTVAGAHLVPAVVGNAVGGIFAGVVIKRSGRYKALILVATLAASGSYLLLILRWHGHTNWLESLYIAPGGFGTGVAQSALFISVQAAMDSTHIAVAASALYLSSSMGMMVGMASVAAVLQQMLRRGLDQRLSDMGYTEVKKWKIIDRALSDVHYIDHAKPGIAQAVVSSYVGALGWTHGLSLVFSLVAFVATLAIKQHRL